MAVILITGASSGIGAALAKSYAKPGNSLVLCARREDRLLDLKEDLQKKGAQVLACTCDVTSPPDLENAVKVALQKFNSIDIVFANAGFGVDGLLEDLSIADYRRQFETNIFGVLHTVKATLEPLKKSKGRLALLGSVMSYIPSAGLSAYNMSKAAVKSLAESLYLELGQSGITVTLVCPGFINTEIRGVDRHRKLHQNFQDPVPSWLNMPADTAAKIINKAVDRRRREVIVTLHAKFAVILQRALPSLVMWVLKLAHIQFLKSYEALKLKREKANKP